ncbi:hypothetical protein [Pseudoalteromonas byunsanensis]|uniref:Uncharacterized protein n=1 Tax=Pseudoalteromonas byunsanensis TaxID=327939 RepID=A0A1S1N225_9GAMM|nr:hypothetical protein [Pseudoalteromonas byunsanensis]OHU93440.1 hypothetical protein BIW53_18950 [Pseudoalteromonas byunsanensis]
MRCIRKILCCSIVMVAMLCSISFAQSKSENPILNFIGGAFDSWGKSEFLGLIGLGGHGATSAQIGQVIDMLNDIEQQIGEEQQELVELQGEFFQLESKIDNNELKSQLQMILTLEESVNTHWTGFSNDVGGLSTFADIAKSQSTLAKLQKFADQNLMCSLGENSDLLSNLNADGHFASGLQAYKTVLGDNLDTLTSQSNYSQTLESYNNSLQMYLFKVVASLQMSYTMQNTYLYLSYNASGFEDLTFCIPGITAKSYTADLNALNSYYQKQINNLVLAVIPELISDDWSALTYPRGTDINPQMANTLSWTGPDGSNKHIIGGGWANSCRIYSWVGVDNSPYTKGIYTSETLAAQCHGEQQQIDYKQYCVVDSHNNAISAFIGKDKQGSTKTALQCVNYQAADYDSDYKTDVLSPTPWFFTGDTDAKFYYYPGGMESFPTAPSINFNGLGDHMHQHNDGAYVETAKIIYPDTIGPQGRYLFYFQYNGTENSEKTSTHSILYINGEMHQKGFHYHWNMTLSCQVNDDFCWVMDSDKNSLCVGGDQLKLTIKSSGDDKANIQYVGDNCS